MTPEQEARFRERGYLHLPGALGRDCVRPVRAHVLAELERLKIWAAGRTLSDRLKGVPLFQQVGKIGQWIQSPGLKERLVTPTLLTSMRRLAGGPLTAGGDAQLLVSLPHSSEWTLAGLNWHRDIAHSTRALPPGVQLFALIDDVAPRGGATLALAGSHLLKRPQLARQGIDRLVAIGPDRSVTVEGVELSVLEMAGRAGDVYLMDLRLIHTPSINATKNVRMMATVRFFAA